MSAIQDAVTLAQDLCVDVPMTWAESTLETAISVACAELSLAIGEAEQREIFLRIQQLHAQRTPAQVARLEQYRGLRK